MKSFKATPGHLTSQLFFLFVAYKQHQELGIYDLIKQGLFEYEY